MKYQHAVACIYIYIFSYAYMNLARGIVALEESDLSLSGGGSRDHWRYIVACGCRRAENVTLRKKYIEEAL